MIGGSAREIEIAERDAETEDRVLLEAAGAGTALGSAKAVDKLEAMLRSQERADLRMETVLILTELRVRGARENSEPCCNRPAV
jgi:hypothetical protein